MRRHILLSEVEGNPAICFDTGLEPRSFARTKMSQSLIEKGFIVSPDGKIETWVASGVCEFSGCMRVWGAPFDGERLDLLLKVETSNDEYVRKMLQFIVHWIRAKILLGDTYSTLNPAATFINIDGRVFFAPPNLSNRCLHVEGTDLDRYNCPDLTGMDAAAFCAGTFLYKILTKTLPYAKDEVLFQDMREGVFLPSHLAAPGLRQELSALIKSALLLPVEKKRVEGSVNNASDILNKLLVLLSDKSGQLYNRITEQEKQKLEKEKKSYLLRQNFFVKTRRFSTRNKYPLLGVAIGLAFVLFVVFSTVNGIKSRPTTEGMFPDTVVYTYYDKFSSLDHVFMEACVNGADKSDINAAAGFYAVAKTRQSYENTTNMPIVPARVWRDNGGELPAPDVFGVTDLTLSLVTGGEDEDMVIYRVNYLLWTPNEFARNRTDVLTLRKDRKKNWRITEILRTER